MNDVMMAFFQKQMPQFLRREFGTVKKAVLMETRAFILQIDARASFLISKAKARPFLEQIHAGRVEELIEEERGLRMVDSLSSHQILPQHLHLTGQNSFFRFDFHKMEIVDVKPATNFLESAFHK